MVRKYTLTVDGADYEVKVDGTTVTVNGLPFTVSVDGGTVEINGTSYAVDVGDGQAIINGIAYPLQVQEKVEAVAGAAPARKAAPAAVGAGTVTAIMPGKIIRMLVGEGDQVQAGQVVCVLEAMKMENELNAPVTGTVKAVYVAPGDDVEMGQALVEIG